jgi:hypothetical protein
MFYVQSFGTGLGAAEGSVGSGSTTSGYSLKLLSDGNVLKENSDLWM